MKPCYYIDGYNVIHHCPRLRRLVKQDFETAREALIESVSRFCSVSGEKAVLIFDGRGIQSAATSCPHGSGLEVMYSPGHLSADTVIERMVYGIRGGGMKRDIIVVTADSGIRELCRAMGALVMNAVNFLDMVDQRCARLTRELRSAETTPLPLRLEDRISRHSLETLKKLRDRLAK